MPIVTRRSFMAAAAAVAAPALVRAQEWSPTRPVRIIVPVIGSTNDVLARLLAPKLQEAFGQPFIVDNKPGAGGNIGAEYVTRAAGDGETLLVGYNGPLAINVTLFDHLPYDPTKDLQPISLMVKSPQYLTVNPNSGFNSVKDLVAKAKAAPTKYSYGSISMGSASHLTMEMFKSAAGFHMTHVPYKGGAPAITALLANEVQAGFFVPGNVQQFASQGKLKLLASTGLKRFADTPDVPTIAESGYPGFEATSWIGLLAPGTTPKNIVDRYNKALVKILHMPDIQARLHEMQYEVVAGTPQEFAGWIKTEIVRWGKVVKASGAKAE
jgi:tripartite-type tricarboxylate transporter receptor subunit TctC